MSRRWLGSGLSLTLGLAAASAPAAAQERPAVSAMTCGSVRALVDARGSVVIGTGPASYEKVVRDAGFCPIDETTSPAYAISADERQCFVGYRCRPIEHGESRQ